MARSSHLFFGNPNNNDLGANEFNLNKEGHYSGGDLQGVINQLDYIQNLGVSADWTALVVANQWWATAQIMAAITVIDFLEITLQ